MKKLSELYECNLDIEIKDIKINSKEVEKGDMFVCINGVNSDRHDFISDAIDKGASCLMVSKDANYSIPFIKVDDVNNELGVLSKKFYDNPTSKLKTIGITGTDGKTTTASIIRNMLGNDKCGYIGTNGVYCKKEKKTQDNTTPEINTIYKNLDNFVKNDLKYVTMEISSEALFRNRTNTLELDIAIITNITEDHLNVHESIENYISSKEKIFSLLKNDGVAILNSDDSYYERLRKNINKRVLTYGKSISSDLVIIEIKEYDTGTIFSFSYGDKIYKVISPLVGEFNVYNLSASILALICLDFSVEEAIEKVAMIDNVDGRCEFIKYPLDYKIVIDYAHTANALKNILTYLNKIKKSRIITVTGSAGGREKEKRKDMGNVVLSLSDFVIFTMDDPRWENVEDIIDDMISDNKNTNYTRISDREEAIKYAIDLAKKDDIILIAGKGKDNYMAIEDRHVDYNDFDVVMKYINNC